MKNQQLVKYFDFFSFFWDEKSSSGIFTIREGNKKPLPHEMVKRSFNMQKQTSKKNFIFLGTFPFSREFTLRERRKKSFSPKGKNKF